MSRLCRFLLSCLRSDQGSFERVTNNMVLVQLGRSERLAANDRRKA